MFIVRQQVLKFSLISKKIWVFKEVQYTSKTVYMGIQFLPGKFLDVFQLRLSHTSCSVYQAWLRVNKFVLVFALQLAVAQHASYILSQGCGGGIRRFLVYKNVRYLLKTNFRMTPYTLTNFDLLQIGRPRSALK